MSVTGVLALCDSAAFLIYGLVCFTSQTMKDDFDRFGLQKLRILSGVLELMGGVGLLVGFAWRPAMIMASAGLAVMMLVAFVYRMRMRDGVAVSIPSFLLIVVNAYLCIKALQS